MYDFLHNLKQNDALGCSLAAHNQKIQAKLEAAGIFYDNGRRKESATHYKRQLRFAIGNQKTDLSYEKENLLRKMADKKGGEGFKFKEAVSKVKSIIVAIENNELGKKIKNWADIIEKLLKQLQGVYSKNRNNDNAVNAALEQIYKKVKRLDKSIEETSRTESADEISSALDSYTEFKEHFLAVYKGYKEIDDKLNGQKEDLQHKDNIFYTFRVEQFSKYTLETLFLGNEVGCCLGLGSPQFQAMVQRILDDAMLFHVAIDEDTGRAAALIWLYFAECADGSIALVSNFFEINGKYARHPSVKEGLLKGLLEFTSQYCNDNHIQRFYMNELSYGEYRGSLNRYPTTQVFLRDKLGGAYMSGGYGDRNWLSTKDVYYLASLHRDYFHVFNPSILSATQVSGYSIIPGVGEKEGAASSSSSSGVSTISLASSSFSLFSSGSVSQPESNAAPEFIPTEFRGLI